MERDLLFTSFIDNHQCIVNKGPSNILEEKDTLDQRERLGFFPKCNGVSIVSKEKFCDNNNGNQDIVKFEEDTNEHRHKE